MAEHHRIANVTTAEQNSSFRRPIASDGLVIAWSVNSCSLIEEKTRAGSGSVRADRYIRYLPIC